MLARVSISIDSVGCWCCCWPPLDTCAMCVIITCAPGAKGIIVWFLKIAGADIVEECVTKWKPIQYY